MTEAHWIALAVGGAIGVLVTYLLVKMARGESEPINMPLDAPYVYTASCDTEHNTIYVASDGTDHMNGESLTDQVRAAAAEPKPTGESVADVKDTF